MHILKSFWMTYQNRTSSEDMNGHLYTGIYWKYVDAQIAALNK